MGDMRWGHVLAYDSARGRTLNLDGGRKLPAGIYFVRLTQGARSVSAKAVVVP